jgi:tRNA threonylcarbamoyladenosine modification (KEOPS) complex  Pcc1 subunit
MHVKKTNNTLAHSAIIQLHNSSSKIAQTIHQALTPEIATSNLEDVHVTVQKIDNLLIFHFKSKNIATLRALINSYLRWVFTLNKSMNVLNLRNSTGKDR